MSDTPKKSKISNIEWGLVIGAAVIIDLIQLGLDVILVGFVANELIDPFTAMSVLFYFYWRDVPLSTDRVISIVAAFAGDAASDGVVPLWTGDILYIFGSVKVAELADKMGIVGQVVQQAAAQKLGGGQGRGGVPGAGAGPTNNVIPLPSQNNSNVLDLRDKFTAPQYGDIGGRKAA